MTTRITRTDFGLKLTEVRKQAGMTRFQLARRAGLDALLLSRLEQGHHEPTLKMVEKLSQALGVRPEHFCHPAER
jgi:transcriptional regulator with XRE-family HTH domain